MTLAYGRLNLRPEHFWGYTPRDIDDLMHGLRDREQYEDNKTDTRIGHILSSIYNLAQAWLKGSKTYKPDQFKLQWQVRQPPQQKTPVEQYNDFLKLKKEFNL